MDAYTYKCPGCGAAVKYEIKAGMVYCDSCGQFYYPEEIVKEDDGKVADHIEEAAFDKAIDQMEDFTGNEDDYMDVNIYHCNSCGAELMTTDVEAASFCSFCGNPSIIKSRIGKELKPNKIIPFKISREEAAQSAREAFEKAKFVPEKAKNITVDVVTPIYMPYYLVDGEISLKLRVTTRKDGREYEDFMEGALKRSIFLDASERFNDEVSRYLNPFPVEEAVDFNPVYLSGFYADRADVKVGESKERAHEYIKEILMDQFLNKIYGAVDTEARKGVEDFERGLGLPDGYRKTSHAVVFDKFTVDKNVYVFCPVYFVTFKVSEKLVILLVNGSTGKIIGNIPVDWAAIEKRQKRDMIIGAVVGGLVGGILCRFLPIVWSLGFLAILGFSYIVGGASAKKHYLKMYELTNSESMFSLYKNRTRV